MKNYDLQIENSQSIAFLAPQETFFLHSVIDELYRTTPLIKFKTLFSEIAKSSKKKVILLAMN